jgi:hypothetical protein
MDNQYVHRSRVSRVEQEGEVMARTLVFFVYAALAYAQGPPGPPPPGRPGAVIDIAGNWVSQVNEDWRWRMLTPPKGDFASVPLNPEGRKIANDWDAAKDEAAGEQCRSYGAAGVLRLPTRIRISWSDDTTMKLETDAGQQTRLFHFGQWKPSGGEPGWQGDSVAVWQKQAQQRGFAPPTGGPAPGRGGTLKVVTTRMRPGYLRKNGVPYSADAVLTEFFDRVDVTGTPFLIVTTVVDDPKYLSDTFIASEQFKWEPDGSKWDPSPCKSR